MSKSTRKRTVCKGHLLFHCARASRWPRECRYVCQFESPLGRAKHVEIAELGIVPYKKDGGCILIREDVVRWYLSGYYSQRNSPLGRTRHLELAEQGTLPSERERRSVYIRRDIVHEYLSSKGRQS